MSRVHRLDEEGRERVPTKLGEVLTERPDVLFACVFGSFLTADAFRDVDVAVWTADFAERSIDLELAASLSLQIGFPVDVRGINDAPVSFLFAALRGRVVAVRDETLLANLMERIGREYHDRAFLLRRATREAFAG